MTDADEPDAADYWSRAAGRRSFAHPLDVARFERLVPKTARVLDVGCGWGRTVAELADTGWKGAVGVDVAPGMIEEGRRLRPDIDLRIGDGRTLPFADASFGAATLFAVLTTIPHDADQAALVAEVRRVLAPGGAVYVSDLLLNDDARNLARYAAAQQSSVPPGPYGTFRLDDGLVCRHHDVAWVRSLLGAFDEIEWVPFTAATMNGHTSRAFQVLARR
ncbi:MAG: class I SAM-dependent methyltransferase [Planctomycetes bacterium]|nr:class I SAM-dependent methyltransferase [Planctomycetota bacterium]